MDTTQAPTDENQVPAPPSADTETDCYADIVSLARSSTSHHVYFVRVLHAVARSLGSPYAAIYVRCASEVIQDDCHRGPTDPGFWKPKLQAFLTDSLREPGTRARVLKPRGGGERIAFVAAPIFDAAGTGIGAIALVVAPFADEDVTPKLAWLESLIRLASHAAGFLNTSGDGEGGPAAGPNPALVRAAACNTPEELAFTITNTLRNKLGCEQVGLGMVVRRRVKILSISGLDHVAKQSTGVVHLRAAMEECYDAGQPLACPTEETWASDRVSTEYRLHKQWFAAAKGDAVASIPLRASDGSEPPAPARGTQAEPPASARGRIVAVLSLRRRANEPFTRQQIEQIRARVEPFAPALLLARDATRGLFQHAADSVHCTVRTLLGPGGRGTKILTALAVAAAGWFLFGTMEYQLAVPCMLAPARIRHVTTPFDGVLSTASAVEGDRVRRDDVLCELDHRDLDQQRAQLIAEIAVLEREKDRAMAEASPVEFQLALASQRLARTKLDIINRRIEQACVTSPITGVVVTGDLRKRIGGVLTRGEPLFEVAPLEEWILELHVPEADADDLAEGLTGHFVSHARPEESRPLRITRVRPRAEVHGRKNVYVVEADIDLPHAWMRAGMEGVAKIDVGARPVWWVVLHRVIEYLQLNFWL